jgi:outer membrane biogenesis lipoprotein LolB
MYMKKKLIKIIVSSIVINSLVSCISVQKNTQSNNLSSKYWVAEGKMSIQYNLNHESKKEAQIINFEWEQKNNDFQINIKSPLQIKSIVIKKENDDLRLKNQEKILNTVEKNYSWVRLKSEIPYNEVSSWIYGKPSIQSIYEPLPSKKIIENGFLQKGWKIEYKERYDSYEEPMPKKIKISNDSYNIKIYVKKWKII